MIFFTADLHLGHANIIKYCNRPFDSVYSMDARIAMRWNSRVKPSDTVYILGDIVWKYNYERSVAFLKSMNGSKFLIRGNHDKRIVKNKMFPFVKDIHKALVPDKDAPGGKRVIVLCHYAMRTWPLSHHGSWHLYGHSHGTLPEDNSLSFDVGVDCWDFYPVSYDEVKEKMIKKIKARDIVSAQPMTEETDLKFDFSKPTDEMIEASKRSDRASAAIEEFFKNNEWKHDKIYEIDCPNCDGKIRLATNSYNGHLRAVCTTDNCFDMME